jgi:bacillithiol system protein YtxJ
MALKDRLQLLTTPEQVNDFLKKNPNSALFKAGTCHKTQETFRAVEEQLGPREDLPIGIVRVVEARPASNHIATLTGIQHESPQIILFKDGQAVFNRDNWDIESEAIAEALEGHFAPVA